MSSNLRYRNVQPMSYAQAKAREQALEDVQHFAKVVTPTSKNYIRLERRWREFHVYSMDPESCLQPKEIMPSKGKLKHFMEWFYDTSVGILNTNITVRSMKNSWRVFRAMYRRKTGNKIPDEIGNEVLAFIETDLAFRNSESTTARREKFLADILDVELLLNFLWSYDDYIFKHPRCRLQLSFLLLLLIYTGARPGTLIESSAYRGSNEGLCYQDFQLIGLPTANGEIELVLKVCFRFEKGNRATQDNPHGKKEFKWITFHEDRSCRGRCPITHFLGLAFADDVFEALQEPADLHRLQIGNHKKSLLFKIKDSKRQQPVFRFCKPNGEVSNDRILSHNELAFDLIELGYRAGFQDKLRAYNLRRGAANAVDGNSRVSANQYAQLLGHSVATMGAFYVSHISGVDVQSSAHSQVPRKHLIDALRRMSLNVNSTAPTELPLAENQKILDSPVFIELRKTELALKRKVQDDKTMNKELRQRYSEATSKRKRAYRSLHTKARWRFRMESFSSSSTAEIRKQIEQSEQHSTEKDTTQVSTQPKFVSQEIFPEQHFIANFFWSPVTETQLPNERLIGELQKLCQPNQYILYRPGESPIEGCCPVCKSNLNQIKYYDRTDHIHKCFKKRHTLHNAEVFDRSRPLQCKWDKCRAQFPVTRSRKAISEHLRKHFRAQLTCLWDGCNKKQLSDLQLRQHLHLDHSVGFKQAKFEPQFCFEHWHCGWFLCEYKWQEHCQAHVAGPLLDCSMARAYGTVIRAYQCPFCLGDVNALPSERFTQFTQGFALNRHLAGHYRKLKSFGCPHPLCKNADSKNVDELKAHFADVHKLKPVGYRSTTGYEDQHSFDCVNEDGDEKKEDNDSDFRESSSVTSFTGFSSDGEADDNEEEEEEEEEEGYDDDDNESFMGFSDGFEEEDIDDDARYLAMEKFTSIPSYELQQLPLTNKTSQVMMIEEEHRLTPIEEDSEEEDMEEVNSGSSGYSQYRSVKRKRRASMSRNQVIKKVKLQ